MLLAARLLARLQNRTRRRHVLAEAGITLLEMLVVLVIIGLLVGLIGPNLLGRVDRAKVDTTLTQLKMLKGALDTLRLDVGRYNKKINRKERIRRRKEKK